MTTQIKAPLRSAACLISLFCLTFGTLKLMSPAIKLGAVWHSTSNPMQGAEITLDTGERFAGALYRTWDGLVLIDGQGGKHDAEMATRSVVLPPYIERSSTLFTRPKSILPPITLWFVYSLLAITLLLAYRRFKVV